MDKQLLKQRIAYKANQCVQCGLCLPYCPTYRLFQNEAESPRGRLFLFKLLAEEKIHPDTSIYTALDHCLDCRACEGMCPSQVKYHEIFRDSRFLLNSVNKKNRVADAAVWFLKYPAFTRAVSKLTSLVFQLPVLNRLRKKLPLLLLTEQLEKQTANNTKLVKKIDTSSSLPTKGKIGLFAGCAAQTFGQDVVNASISLLEYAGYEVIYSDSPSCCGAVNIKGNDAHSRYSQDIINVYSQYEHRCDAIVSLTHSCSDHLRSNQDVFALRTEAVPVKDIIEFLHENLLNMPIKFKPAKQATGVHIPCSLKALPNGEKKLLELLALIPDTVFKTVPYSYCCGSAGRYFLDYPDLANRLGDDKIQHIDAMHIEQLVSSNIGCSIHLANRITTAGKSLEIIHPVTLLYQLLEQ